MIVSRCAAFFGSAALTVLLAPSCVGWVVRSPLEQLVAGKARRDLDGVPFERYVARTQRLLDHAMAIAIVAGAVLADSIGIPGIGQTVGDCGCCGG